MDDHIRIRAKRLVCRYLLYRYDCCGRDKNDYETFMNIVDTIPSLHDSKEMIALYTFIPERYEENHKSAIDELLYLLQSTLIGYCFSSDRFQPVRKIEIISSMLDLFKITDSDENYSKNRIHIIYAYGRLGLYYYQINDIENSFKNLTIAMKFAKAFDKRPDAEYIYRFYEQEPEFREMNMSSRMKELFTKHYPFSDEFKERTEFKQIISML